MNYPKTFKSKKYPEFIRENIFIDACPKPHKIFPKLGLHNNSMKLKNLKFTYDEFSKTNLKSDLFTNKNIKIHFSSDGPKGFWDIATMSMRGIRSCMRWDSNESTSLVGSLLDPCAALIYLTDNTKTKYGRKMIARSVVRFVLTEINKEQRIFIEKPYVNDDYSEIFDLDWNEDDYLIYDINENEILNKIFSNYIKQYSNVATTNCDGDSVFIPYSKIMTKMRAVDEYRNYESYSDAELLYDDVHKNSKIAKLIK